MFQVFSVGSDGFKEHFHGTAFRDALSAWDSIQGMTLSGISSNGQIQKEVLTDEDFWDSYSYNRKCVEKALYMIANGKHPCWTSTSVRLNPSDDENPVYCNLIFISIV
jgi:hypothetical protein